VNCVLLSTAYFPPVSWLAAALQSGNILIEAHETYPKQTYRNRCNIATSNGLQSLTVPVKRINGNHTVTSDIIIDNSKNWKRLHWRSIITAYNNAPYFLFYRDLLEPIFNKEHSNLLELNQEILAFIFKSFRAENITISNTKQFERNPLHQDLRNYFHPKKEKAIDNKLIKYRYIQVFEDSIGFLPDLSCIDLLFNLGPDAQSHITKIQGFQNETVSID
jgi:hypothetical protein